MSANVRTPKWERELSTVRIIHDRKARKVRVEYKGRKFDYCEFSARLVERTPLGVAPLVITNRTAGFITPDGRPFPHMDWAVEWAVDSKGEARA